MAAARRSSRSAAPGCCGVLAAVAICVQLVGLYRATAPPQPAWFPNADKLEHAVIFGLPVAVGHAGPAARSAGSCVAIFAVPWPVVSELIQHFFYTHRTGDPFDVLADVDRRRARAGGVAVIRARAGARHADTGGRP